MLKEAGWQVYFRMLWATATQNGKCISVSAKSCKIYGAFEAARTGGDQLRETD